MFSKRKLAISPVIDSVRGQALFRSYGRLFAEFLNEESLVHLGLLDLSTCVGLRYGWQCTRVWKLFWSAPSRKFDHEDRFIRSLFYYLDGYNQKSAPANMPRTPNNTPPVREY